MKNYFTISEFAKLRGIDINSLRYYEKLNILKPAYVDPKTKYRYYSAEQLPVLDIILLSINLGIPLKQLKDYIDENGKFQNRALVEEGKRLTEEKIKELKNGLRNIEHTLQYLEDTEKYAEIQGFYTRTIPKRRFVASEFKGDFKDVNAVENIFGFLYNYAQEKKYYPVMPMGILLQYEKLEASKYICWEITEAEAEDEWIIELPEVAYQCLQIDWKIGSDIQKIVENTFEMEENATVFISNMAQSRFAFGTKVGEIQMVIKEDEESEKNITEEEQKSILEILNELKEVGKWSKKNM